MKIVNLLIINIFLTAFAFAQIPKAQINSSKLPELDPHFQDEYTVESPTDTIIWSKQKPGMHVSFGSTDRLYFRSEVPDLPSERALWEETGWKGERLNAVILVWASDTLSQVRFTVNDLVNSKGSVVSKKNIQLNMVRYVLSNYPYNASDVTCDVTPYKNGYLMPDRFEAFERFDVPGRTVRPVWLSLDVPPTTDPGVYQGTIEIKSKNYAKTLIVKIKVQDQVLPKPYDWKFRLDLWQNPWVIAWYYHVDPWSDEHKALLKKHLKLYADAGGKYITTYAVHSPWADNSYMIEGAMIEWIKLDNPDKAGWKFDYTIFDQYVELAMESGIDKAITIYTPIPWGNRFRYLDEKTGNYNYETWTPDSDKFKAFWKVFLDDLKAHLEQKGWLDKTYLGINENELGQTLAAIKVIKEHSNKWRITYAGDWHKELDHLLDDYSFLYGKEPSLAEAKERSARGFTSTYYVCCNPAKPNNFVFSPPAEGRWISWYSAAYGYDGFLRWAYDAWPQDPVRDARHGSWAAGDCYLVYPGANSSIRFEKLREGIVDFEKIRILRELASKSSDKNIKNRMQELERHLKSFTEERDFSEQNIVGAVSKGKKMLEQLSDDLSH